MIALTLRDWLIAAILARPKLQIINKALFNIAIRGMGYQHCCDPKRSGELWLVRKLATLGMSSAIDIGANRGDYARMVLENSDAYVVAVEPLPEAFEKLGTLAQEFPDRFTRVCCALGVPNSTGTAVLHASNPSSTHASMHAAALSESTLETLAQIHVPLRSLDIIADEERLQRVDFIKIDVEGNEFDVIAGGKKMIENYKPLAIQFEYNRHHYHRGQTVRQFADCLPEYSLFQLLPWNRGLVQRDVNRPESSLGYYSNFVLVRRGLESLFISE